MSGDGYSLVPSDLVDKAGDWQEAETAMASARSSLAALTSSGFPDTVSAAVDTFLDAWVEHASTLRDQVDRAGFTLEGNAVNYRRAEDAAFDGLAVLNRPPGPGRAEP